MGLLSRLARGGGRRAQEHIPPQIWDLFGDTLATREARADRMFPISVFRGLEEEAQSGRGWQWFSDNPDIANTYARARGTGAAPGAPNVLPARINPGKVLDVDAKGSVYSSVPIDDLPKDVREVMGATPNLDRYGVGTDRIAGAANSAGYDSVRFRNIRDALSSGANTPVSTVYVTFKPESARSRFAQFNPWRVNDADILAGLGLAVSGGTGGLLSLAQRQRHADA